MAEEISEELAALLGKGDAPAEDSAPAEVVSESAEEFVLTASVEEPSEAAALVVDVPIVDELALAQAQLLSTQGELAAANSRLAVIEGRVKEWFDATLAYAPGVHLLSTEEHFKQNWHTLREWLES